MIARELVAWRERTASAHDRTVQSVLGDAALIELAKRRPSTIRDLEQIRGFSNSGLRRRGAELLDVIHRGADRVGGPQIMLDRLPRHTAPDPADAPLVALCEALVRARARESDLAYELIAARSDLQAIVAAARSDDPEPDIRTLHGWRRELVGAELLELLDGRVSLSVRGGRLDIGSH